MENYTTKLELLEHTVNHPPQSTAHTEPMRKATRTFQPVLLQSQSYFMVHVHEQLPAARSHGRKITSLIDSKCNQNDRLCINKVKDTHDRHQSTERESQPTSPRKKQKHLVGSDVFIVLS